MLQDILETVQFIRDHGATKDDLAQVEHRLDAKISRVHHEMIEHVDGFVALYQKHEVELAAVVYRQERMEEKFNKLLMKLNIDIP